MTPKIPIGVNVAVINDNKVLLTRREDFEVWCLPGGAIEPGESLAQAGIRETREETGLDVQLTRLIGLYSHPYMSGFPHTAVVFAAKPVGGELCCQLGEVIEIGYFGLDDLPHDLTWGYRQRAEDALCGASGLVYSSSGHWPEDMPMTRREIYAMRDASGLSRKEFFYKYLAFIDAEYDRLEIGSEEL